MLWRLIQCAILLCGIIDSIVIAGDNSTCPNDSQPPVWFQNFLEVYKEQREEDRKTNERNREEDRKMYERNRKEDRFSFQEGLKNIYNLIKLRHHDRQSEVALSLESASFYMVGSDFAKPSDQIATGHYIFYREKFFTLTVKHAGPVKKVHWTCDNVDVQILFPCPTSHAINATIIVPLRMGDEASAFGYIFDEPSIIPRFWKGTLAGKLGESRRHEESKTTFFAEEYLFHGAAELLGMSGGPTANGYGYTGLVHGNYKYASELISLACVIPFSVISSECIDTMFKNASFYAQFKGTKECPYVKIINIPQF